MNYEIEELVEKYLDILYQIAYQNILDTVYAEEIVKSVFIKTIRNIEKIKNEKKMEIVLIRDTVKLCKNYNKKQKKKNFGVELKENDRYLSNENVRYVIEEITKLNPKYRNIVYLYYYKGYQVVEISKITRMFKIFIKSKLSKAKKELKEILEERGDLKND